MYYATHLSKEVEEYQYEHDCVGQRRCTMSDRIDIGAETLPELLKKLGEAYGLKIDDVFIPGEEEEDITHIGFNGLEMGNGDEPSGYYLKRWKEGVTKLYLADYTFSVEYREVRALRLSEFTTAGIKHHH